MQTPKLHDNTCKGEYIGLDLLKRFPLSTLYPSISTSETQPYNLLTSIDFIPRGTLQSNLLRIPRVALMRTIRTLKSPALAQPIQTLLRHDVPTRHHHRRVDVVGLLFTDGADEDGVEDHAPG